MNNNYTRVYQGLKLFRDAMLPFIVEKLQAAYGNRWWEQGVARCFMEKDIERLRAQFEKRHTLVVELPGQHRFLCPDGLDLAVVGDSGGTERLLEGILNASLGRQVEPGRSDLLQVAVVIQVGHTIELESIARLGRLLDTISFDPPEGRSVFPVARLELDAALAGPRVGVVVDPFAEYLAAVGKLRFVDRMWPEDAQTVVEHDGQQPAGQQQRGRQRAAGRPDQRFTLAPESPCAAALLQ